jgi:hypothetical protein
MRIIDTTAPTDLEKFWMTLGEMRVMAAINGQSDEVVIEEKASVVEALNVPDAAEAGRPAFLRGVDRKLEEAIASDAWAVKNERGYVSWVKAVLAAYVESIPAGKFTVRPEKRTLKRKTVEQFDDDGRIVSMLEEEIHV